VCRHYAQMNFITQLYMSRYSLQTNSVASVHERTIPTERPLFVGEVSVNSSADIGCHVVSVTDPYGRILNFQTGAATFSFTQLLNCTHEFEWTLFQTHYFSTSGSVARNSEY
jgi:hypothetical protein